MPGICAALKTTFFLAAEISNTTLNVRSFGVQYFYNVSNYAYVSSKFVTCDCLIWHAHIDLFDPSGV